MEIIEKQVEKVKEVPADNYGYNYGRRDINGKANAGLTLGIIGTALGAWALFGGRRSASLLGGTGTGSGADANIAIATCGGSANGVNAPTAFQAWEKECEDTLALQAGIYNLAMTYQNNRFADRQQLIEKYKQNLEAAKQLRQQVQPVQQPAQHRMIWDDIDAEINPMSDEQKSRLLQDEDYVDTYTRIQDMVQAEILSLVKGRIEATPEGKELLQRQLKIVRSLKSKIIQDTNREMEMFRKFREFSKAHPEVTYDEFIKANM